MPQKRVGLTERQAQVFEFIKLFIAKRGWSPSYREIGKGCGMLSTATVANHVYALQKRGWITRTNEGEHRSLRVIPEKV